MPKQKNKVVLGMSGGVDSSVSLYLLKKLGYEVIGLSLKYDVWKKCQRENVCCSEESLANAKRVCEYFNVEHVTVDVAGEFQDEVIEYFKHSLKKGETPSPCVFCNQNVKFKQLIKFADRVDAPFVATGHYARVRDIKGKFELLKGKDEGKDQSYSLSFLDQKVLSRCVFPLGDLMKREVYEISKEIPGLSFYEKIKQSQDFCFLPSGQMKEYIDDEIKPLPGKIVDGDGKILGEHEGLSYYTIGQRKAIGLPGGPYYVLSKNEKTHELIVTKNEKEVSGSEILLNPYNLISGKAALPKRVTAKLRSTAKLSEAELFFKNDSLVLKFKKNQFAPTVGQIAVFYKGEICLGGGVIRSY